MYMEQIVHLGPYIMRIHKFIKFMSHLYKPDNQPFMINACTWLANTNVECASEHAVVKVISPTFQNKYTLLLLLTYLTTTMIKSMWHPRVLRTPSIFSKTCYWISQWIRFVYCLVRSKYMFCKTDVYHTVLPPFILK